MRIGCIQFAPIKGDIDKNITRADTVLRKPAPAKGNEPKDRPELDIYDLDLLVLPELAFTGYGFKSASEIEPSLEASGSGVSALWARTRALELDCTVVVGYAERYESKQRSSKKLKHFNSTLIVNRDGDIVGNYRKKHLQPADDIWAEESEEPFHSDTIDGIGKAVIGTSMDMNPYKFQEPWDSYGLTFHVMQVQPEVLIINMAWPTADEAHNFLAYPEEPDLETVLFWISRLEPIILADQDKELIVVLCNRCGAQDGTTFAGSSTVLGFLGEEVRVYGILGRGDENILKVDTENPPKQYCRFHPNEEMFVQRIATCRALMRRPDVLSGLDSQPALLTEASKAMHDRFNTSRSLEAKIKSMQPVSAVELKNPWDKPRIPNQGQPKKVPTALSLAKPGSKAWEYMQPNVGTPSAPSPTPHTMRPRITVQPVESFTHRFIESQQELEHQRRNTPHPEVNLSPTIVSGYVNFDLPSATEISMSEFEMSPQVPRWADGLARQYGLRSKPPASISMRSEATVFSDLAGSEYGTIFSGMENGNQYLSRANIGGSRTKALLPQSSRQQMSSAQSRPRAKTAAAPIYVPHGRGANDPDTPISPIGYSNSPVIHRRGNSDIANLIYSQPDMDDPEDFYRTFNPSPSPQPVAPHKNGTPHPFPSTKTRPRGNSASGARVLPDNKDVEFTRPRAGSEDQASISSSLINNHRGRRSKRGYRYEETHVVPTASKTGTGRKRSTSRLVDLSQFRRVEEYPSPNCPVHGKKIQRALSQDRLDFYIG